MRKKGKRRKKSREDWVQVQKSGEEEKEKEGRTEQWTGEKEKKKSRATKSSFICTVSNNYQCIYSIPQGIGHCLMRQWSACIINESACIINVWGCAEIFPKTVKGISS